MAFHIPDAEACMRWREGTQCILDVYSLHVPTAVSDPVIRIIDVIIAPRFPFSPLPSKINDCLFSYIYNLSRIFQVQRSISDRPTPTQTLLPTHPRSISISIDSSFPPLIVLCLAAAAASSSSSSSSNLRGTHCMPNCAHCSQPAPASPSNKLQAALRDFYP